jgi:hypothetical protein
VRAQELDELVRTAVAAFPAAPATPAAVGGGGGGGGACVSYERFVRACFDEHGVLPRFLRSRKSRDGGDPLGWSEQPPRRDVRFYFVML